MIQAPANPTTPIERAAKAIIEAGYDLSRLDVEEGTLLLAVADSGADDAIEEIRELVAPECVAEYTGDANMDEWDVQVVEA